MKQSILEKYDTPFEYFGAFMNLMIAYQFYSLLTNPQPEDIFKIADFATLIGFEFIMVHSGVFMSVMPKKFSLIFFIPVYGIFALIMNEFVSDNSILYLYCIVVFNRMRFAFSDVSQQLKNRNIFISVLSVLAYFFLIIGFSINSEQVPHLGLNKIFLESINYYKSIKVGGLLTEQPHVSMSMGITYYVLLALIEIWMAGKTFSSYKQINTNTPS